MSLRTKILVALLIPLVLISSIFGAFSYFKTREELSKQINTTAALAAQEFDAKVEGSISVKEAAITSMIAFLGTGQVQEADVIKYIKALKSADKSFMNIVVGLEDGNIYQALDAALPPGFDHKTRPWYKNAMAADGMAYTDVYIDAFTNEPVITVSHKIIRDGKTVGVLGIDWNLKEVQQMAAAIKFGNTGSAVVLDNKGQFIYHPTLTLQDNINTIEGGAMQRLAKTFFSGAPATEFHQYRGIDKFYASSPIGKTGWVLVIAAPVSDLYQSVTAIGQMAMVSTILSIVLLGSIIFYITRRMINPITKITNIAEYVAKGNLSIDSEELARGSGSDEIGRLSRSFNAMVTQLRTLVRQVNDSAQHVVTASQQLTAGAEQSSKAAAQVTEAIVQVAGGAQEQLNLVASSREEAAKVADISRDAIEVVNATGKLTERSVAAALDGQAAIQRVINQMEQISTRTAKVQGIVNHLAANSQQISAIATLISGIAGQTDLLALNAAIEAARAGEQGRGFAVVAEEVRKLAEQSNGAAKEIAQLLDGIQGEMTEAVAAMEEGVSDVQTGTAVANSAEVAFGRLSSLIREMGDKAQANAVAFEHIVAGNDQILHLVSAVDAISRQVGEQSQTVSASAEEQLASVEEISAASKDLVQKAGELQSAVNTFKL